MVIASRSFQAHRTTAPRIRLVPDITEIFSSFPNTILKQEATSTFARARQDKNVCPALARPFARGRGFGAGFGGVVHFGLGNAQGAAWSPYYP